VPPRKLLLEQGRCLLSSADRGASVTRASTALVVRRTIGAYAAPWALADAQVRRGRQGVVFVAFPFPCGALPWPSRSACPLMSYHALPPVLPVCAACLWGLCVQVRSLDAPAHAVDRRVIAALLVSFLTLQVGRGELEALGSPSPCAHTCPCLLACQRSLGRWAGHASRRSKDALAIVGGMLNLTPQEREAVGVDDEIPADPVLQVGEAGRLEVFYGFPHINASFPCS
jgi:hypothetical protein